MKDQIIGLVALLAFLILSVAPAAPQVTHPCASLKLEDVFVLDHLEDWAQMNPPQWNVYRATHFQFAVKTGSDLDKYMQAHLRNRIALTLKVQ